MCLLIERHHHINHRLSLTFPIRPDGVFHKILSDHNQNILPICNRLSRDLLLCCIDLQPCAIRILQKSLHTENMSARRIFQHLLHRRRNRIPVQMHIQKIQRLKRLSLRKVRLLIACDIITAGENRGKLLIRERFCALAQDFLIRPLLAAERRKRPLQMRDRILPLLLCRRVALA